MTGKLILPAALLIAAVLGTSCKHEIKSPPMRIAVSKTSPNYINWLKRADSTLEIINCYGIRADSVVEMLKSCSGLLVTGGEDVNPALYGKASDTSLCGKIDNYRDTLETQLIHSAIGAGMPVLCICRGEQILNVTLGGDLIPDIPSQFGMSVIHQCDDYKNCFHKIRTAPESVLQSIVKSDSGFVNTNHHQAICNAAPDLKISAWSTDGLPEAVEWAKPEGKSFLIGVQWHPERMDTSNSYSGKLVQAFLLNCREFQKPVK